MWPGASRKSRRASPSRPSSVASWPRRDQRRGQPPAIADVHEVGVGDAPAAVRIRARSPAFSDRLAALARTAARSQPSGDGGRPVDMLARPDRPGRQRTPPCIGSTSSPGNGAGRGPPTAPRPPRTAGRASCPSWDVPSSGPSPHVGHRPAAARAYARSGRSEPAFDLERPGPPRWSSPSLLSQHRPVPGQREQHRQGRVAPTRVGRGSAGPPRRCRARRSRRASALELVRLRRSGSQSSDDRGEVRGVGEPGGGQLAALGEPLDAVLADRLEHPVAHLGRPGRSATRPAAATCRPARSASCSTSPARQPGVARRPRRGTGGVGAGREHREPLGEQSLGVGRAGPSSTRRRRAGCGAGAARSGCRR